MMMVIAALFYVLLPWYVQMAIWIVNLFIPDPVPFFDEFVMFLPMAYKIKNIIVISEFLRKYGIALAVLMGTGVVALIVYMIAR